MKESSMQRRGIEASLEAQCPTRQTLCLNVK
jgi:hypothetical protein